MLLAALPLHFVYNSAVYSTASTSSYNVYVVAPDFFEGAFVPAAASSGSSDMPATTEYKSIQNLATFNRSDSEWEAMDMPALVGRYSSGSVDTYRDVVLVAKQTDFNMSGLGVLFHYTAAVSDDSTQNLWLCQFFTRPWSYNCDSGSIGNMSRPAWSIEAPDGSSDLFRPQYWTVDIKNVRVDLQPRGLSEKNTLACRLIANPLFWWLTAACNLVIAACLSGMCCQFQGPTTPLVTVGDVIDSFLTTPSAEISRSGCTYGYGAFKNMFRPALWPRPVLSVVLVAFVYFARGSDGVSVKDVFRKGGFGSFDRNAAIWGFNTASTVVSPRAKWRLVLLANTPQFVFSMTYLLYNAVLTTMLAEHEWQAFGQHQQPCTLRVSQPRGQQRSTFFLSLPYQYGVPFLAISGAMQWLVSQSLFFAEVDLWTERGERMYGDAGFATLGYSTLAMFWVIVVGFLSWLFVVVLGTVRSFPVGMPLMGACSAVIAASCHVPVELVCGGQNRRDVAAGAVSWGAVKEIGRGDTGGGGGGGGGGDNDDDDGEEEEQWLSFVPGQAEQAVAHQVYG
ncbi:hypothetical protein B0T22DRAFT_482949 [Podospora appendiculata]|uniref:DUF6536 domain-containing protein n=1 Tax=Podospora appendiculata TaxID=314037 RepID=A0AAE0X6L0_9PEZI|nr:hypothetical protein B0T22DRAFT_482949 [Podospora appendiculata]